ncbi:MAG: hypothetical protein LBR43_03460 [Spiroplasmataceae bacterium]|nr:hypothetical protein [Spiroplasmataceae bacterium]
MSNQYPTCPNCGKDNSNSPPMVPKGCQGWCLDCIQQKSNNKSGEKCSNCKGSLHSKKNDNEFSWWYNLPEKKVCESCWKQEEKKYRNHDWWGINHIYLKKPTGDADSSMMTGCAGSCISYNWNTQKWAEDFYSEKGNPSLEAIEEDKKRVRQYLKDKGIRTVRHSGSFLTGFNMEYTDGRKSNNHSIDTPELTWINSYFGYLAEERSISDNNREELSKLFFGQETDSSSNSNNNLSRERERERESKNQVEFNNSNLKYNN